MTAPPIRRRREGRKTYPHLAGRGCVPTAYEIASSELLYYPGTGIAVSNPVAEWMQHYQAGSALEGAGWERFADPGQMTYFTYCAERREREAYVDGLFEQAALHESPLEPRWLKARAACIGPLRYVCEALKMSAGYLGSLAPAGAVTIALALQCGDEVGRIHLFARHLYVIEAVERTPAEQRAARLDAVAARALRGWETDAHWQPLRRVFEQLLTTFDWAECFAATNLAVKPIVDAYLTDQLAARAQAAGDGLSAALLRTLKDDAHWQQRWSLELARLACELDAGNRELLLGWFEHWTVVARNAVAQLSGSESKSQPGAFEQQVLAVLEGSAT